MTATDRDLITAAADRWRSLDPLVGVPGVPADGWPLHVDDAVAVLTRFRPEPGTTGSLWGAADQIHLIARVASAATLHPVIDAWRDAVAGLDDPPGADSAAVVAWPSRDVEGSKILLARGFTPRRVVAARPTGRPGADPPADARVRTGRPDDLAAVVAVRQETISYDAHTGAVVDRPGCTPALVEEVVGALADPDGRVWVAERGDRVVGVVWLAPPAESDWIAPLVTAEPAAYLPLLGVTADERGAGVGAALVAHAHRHCDDTGVAVTLLHHGVANPRSAPFWSRHGYRPLWTMWETRPAGALR